MSEKGFKRNMRSLQSIFDQDGLRRHLLTYTWLPTLLSLRCCSQTINQAILQDPALMYELLNILLEHSHRGIDMDKDAGYRLWDVISLGSRLTTWPTRMMLPSPAAAKASQHAGYEVHELSPAQRPAGARERCYAYSGCLDGSSRSLVADDHWPVLGGEHAAPAIRPVTVLPFTKVHVQQSSQSQTSGDLAAWASGAGRLLSGSGASTSSSASKRCLTNSCLAYFEVTIHGTDKAKKAAVELESRRRRGDDISNDLPCVCIGIAKPGFDYLENMPGWDDYSIGFHGDDGRFFLSGDSYATGVCFGEGDTIGLGILHALPDGHLLSGLAVNSKPYTSRSSHDAIVLTKNGIILAIAPMLDGGVPFARVPWFPVVGIDCYWIVEVNFGQTVPFLFDCHAFEHDLHFSIPPQVFSHAGDRRRFMDLLARMRLVHINHKAALAGKISVMSQCCGGGDATLLPKHVHTLYANPSADRLTGFGADDETPLIAHPLLCHLVLVQDVLFMSTEVDIDERYADFMNKLQPGSDAAHLVQEYERIYGDHIAFNEFVDEDGDEEVWEDMDGEEDEDGAEDEDAAEG